MNITILLLTGVLILGILLVLAVAVGVMLFLQNRREDVSTPPPSLPQSYQPVQTGLKMPMTPEPTDQGGLQQSEPVDPEWVQQVRQLVQSGNKIEAIRLFRENTNLGLKEAKDAVEAIAAGRVVITTTQTTRNTQFSPELTQQVIQLLRENRKIEAIKLIRQETNLGLKESKDIADELEKSLIGGTL